MLPQASCAIPYPVSCRLISKNHRWQKVPYVGTETWIDTIHGDLPKSVWRVCIILIKPLSAKLTRIIPFITIKKQRGVQTISQTYCFFINTYY